MRHWLAAAFVAVGAPAFAGDDVVQLGRYQPPAGGFAGAVQTAVASDIRDVDDEDTILAHGYHRGFRGGYGGYRGYYGGGYRSYYGGGYRSYYGGYRSYGYYRPYYSYGIGYGLGYSRSYYGSGYGSYYSTSYSYPVSSYAPAYYVNSWPTSSVVTASATSQPPTIINNYYYTTPAPSTSQSSPLTQPRPMIPPSDSGTPKYDGGPASPVPQPTPDPAKPMAPPSTNNVKISTGKTTGNKYPAYGEK